jgi:hypothetical protein
VRRKAGRDRRILPPELLHQVAVLVDHEKSCGKLNSSLARNNDVNIRGGALRRARQQIGSDVADTGRW